jgi:hypothetical protein
VSDDEGRKALYAGRFLVSQRLTITTLATSRGIVGKRYKQKLRTTGGLLPREWVVLRGELPQGLTLNATLGLVSGVPRQAGRFRVVFEVTDALGVTAKKNLRFVIKANPKAKKKPKKPALAGGDDAEACEILNALINRVEAQSGKKIDPSIADALIADATRIRSELGCSP